MSGGEYLTPDEFERRERVWRKRDGTMDACKLQCETELPRQDASGEDWTAFHEQMLNRKPKGA